MRKIAAATAGLVLVLALAAAALWWWSPRVAGWLGALSPEVLYRVDTDARVAALTIDDAPTTGTSRILDVLDRHGVRATFFVIAGRVEGREDVIRRMVEEGHELGNHMLRDVPGVTLPADTFRRRLRRAHRILSRFDDPRWLRPGAGRYDGTMVRIAREHGYRLALGSVYPFDTIVTWTPLLATFLRRKVRPGSVIVLHDGRGRARRTVDVLDRALPALRRAGYRIVPLGELVSPGRE